jgi:hypothetical protein
MTAMKGDDWIVVVRRAVEAWDSTPLDRSKDGMLQECMEDLRAHAWAGCDHKRTKTVQQGALFIRWQCLMCGLRGEFTWD